MDTDNIISFHNSVIQLSKDKSVGHSTDCDISYLDYKRMYTSELIKLKDEELIQLYFTKIKGKGRYFNIFLQAWYACINLEMKKRSLNYEI